LLHPPVSNCYTPLWCIKLLHHNINIRRYLNNISLNNAVASAKSTLARHPEFRSMLAGMTGQDMTGQGKITHVHLGKGFDLRERKGDYTKGNSVMKWQDKSVMQGWRSFTTSVMGAVAGCGWLLPSGTNRTDLIQKVKACGFAPIVGIIWQGINWVTSGLFNTHFRIDLVGIETKGGAEVAEQTKEEIGFLIGTPQEHYSGQTCQVEFTNGLAWLPPAQKAVARRLQVDFGYRLVDRCTKAEFEKILSTKPEAPPVVNQNSRRVRISKPPGYLGE
jgi:hypothetical protein